MPVPAQIQPLPIYGGAIRGAIDLAAHDLYADLVNFPAAIVSDGAGGWMLSNNLTLTGAISWPTGSSISGDGFGGINGPGGTNISSSGVITGNGSGLTGIVGYLPLSGGTMDADYSAISWPTGGSIFGDDSGGVNFAATSINFEGAPLNSVSSISNSGGILTLGNDTDNIYLGSPLNCNSSTISGVPSITFSDGGSISGDGSGGINGPGGTNISSSGVFTGNGFSVDTSGNVTAVVLQATMNLGGTATPMGAFSVLNGDSSYATNWFNVALTGNLYASGSTWVQYDATSPSSLTQFSNNGAGISVGFYSATPAGVASNAFYDGMTLAMTPNDDGTGTATLQVNGLIGIQSLVLASLPGSAAIGQYLDCADGRNPGEISGGSGTGCLVRWNGAFWAVVGTGLQVTN